MTGIETTLADLRAYLDDNDPDALATVFVENKQFYVDLAGDDEQVAVEYLLAALLRQAAAVRGGHPEDTAAKVLAAAEKLGSHADAELFVDRSGLE